MSAKMNSRKPRISDRGHDFEGCGSCRCVGRCEQAEVGLEIHAPPKRPPRSPRSPGPTKAKPNPPPGRIRERGGECSYCGQRPSTTDHVLPLAYGGLYRPENMLRACIDCNAAKADLVLPAVLERTLGLRQAVATMERALVRMMDRERDEGLPQRTRDRARLRADRIREALTWLATFER